MSLDLAHWHEQAARWPADGRHVLAQHDANRVVVYQAYGPSIARAAVADQRFGGGGFSFGRMTWVKPNFLWMMYRSGWARKPGQEQVLAVTLERSFFELVLALATTGVRDDRASVEELRELRREEPVRLQWDPDHGPQGEPLPRRAIQLGLRGEAAAEYATDAILSIEDVTAFVHEQRQWVPDQPHRLVTPRESVSVPSDPSVGARLGLSSA